MNRVGIKLAKLLDISLLEQVLYHFDKTKFELYKNNSKVCEKLSNLVKMYMSDVRNSVDEVGIYEDVELERDSEVVHEVMRNGYTKAKAVIILTYLILQLTQRTKNFKNSLRDAEEIIDCMINPWIEINEDSWENITNDEEIFQNKFLNWLTKPINYIFNIFK